MFLLDPSWFIKD